MLLANLDLIRPVCSSADTVSMMNPNKHDPAFLRCDEVAGVRPRNASTPCTLQPLQSERPAERLPPTEVNKTNFSHTFSQLNTCTQIAHAYFLNEAATGLNKCVSYILVNESCVEVV